MQHVVPLSEVSIAFTVGAIKFEQLQYVCSSSATTQISIVYAHRWLSALNGDYNANISSIIQLQLISNKPRKKDNMLSMGIIMLSFIGHADTVLFSKKPR